MRKKFTLLFVALIAVAAFAAQQAFMQASLAPLATPDDFYILVGSENTPRQMVKNAETGAFELTLNVVSEDVSLCFTDDGTFRRNTATSSRWDNFNANHRFSLTGGEQTLENSQIGTPVQLQKVNGSIVLTDPGNYKFSVTFGEEGAMLTVTKTPFTLYVIGGKQGSSTDKSIFSYLWGKDEAGEDVNPSEVMQFDEESGNYVWTKKGVDFDAAQTIQFKIARKIGTDTEVQATYPANARTISIPRAGKYDITVTFNLRSTNITSVAAEYADITISPKAPTLLGRTNISDELKKATVNANPAKVARNLTINLSSSRYAYVIDEPIVAAGSVVINGNKATIDADDLEGAFVLMNNTPGVAKNAKNFYEVDKFLIKNVTINGINTYLYDDNKTAYAFNEFAVENSVLKFNTNTESALDAPFRFQAGGPVKFSLKQNTLYSVGNSGFKYFVRINSGNFPDKAFATFDGPYTWEIVENTFYKVLSETRQFLNGGRVANNFKKTSLTIEKNIFADCLTSDSFFQNLYGGKRTDSDRANFVAINEDLNTYIAQGKIIDMSKWEKSGTALACDPLFEDAEDGDFTLGASSQQAEKKTGDPRWRVNYDGKFSTLVKETLASVEEGPVTLTLYKDYTDDAAVEIPLGKQLTIDGAGHTLTLGRTTNFQVNDNLTLKNLNIDATSLTSPLITPVTLGREREWTSPITYRWIQSPETAKNTDEGKYEDAEEEFHLLSDITIDNVKIKNLKNNLLRSEYVSIESVTTPHHWALENLTVTNSMIQLASNSDFISFGAIKNITVSNNTIYNTASVTADTRFINNTADLVTAGKAFGTLHGTSTYNYALTSNTFYNVSKNFANKVTNFIGTAVTLSKNIFVGTSGLTTLAQDECTNTIEDNVTWGDDIAEEEIATYAEDGFEDPAIGVLDLEAEDGEDGSIAGINMCIDAASWAAYLQAGDPRWLTTYEYTLAFYDEEGEKQMDITLKGSAEKYEFEFTLDKITKYYIANENQTKYYLKGKEGVEDLMGEKNVVLDVVYGLNPVQLIRGAYNIEASLLVFMPGTYKVTVTPKTPYHDIEFTGTPLNSDIDGTLVVVDSNKSDMFDFGEDATDNDHVMTRIEATGLYLMLYEGINLAPGYYPFHIVANNEGTSEGGNGGVVITEGNKYDVAIVYDPVLNRISVNAVVTGTTGIDGITKDELINGAIYNLNGQRLNSPAKGLNIINGRKVVIK